MPLMEMPDPKVHLRCGVCKVPYIARLAHVLHPDGWAWEWVFVPDKPACRHKTGSAELVDERTPKEKKATKIIWNIELEAKKLGVSVAKSEKRTHVRTNASTRGDR